MSYEPRRMLLYGALDSVTIEGATEQTGFATNAAPVGTVNVPPIIAARMPQVGTKLQLIVWGGYKLPSTLNTLTLDIKVLLGSASFTVTIPTSLFLLLNLGGSTYLTCYMSCYLKFITMGANAVVKRTGSLGFQDASGKFNYQGLRGANLSVTDTGVDNIFDVRAKWSAAGGSLIIDDAELTVIG